MASYTPNLHLGKPANNDQVKDFPALFNANMDILDGLTTYSAGDGIDITSNVISLEYLKVVNGAVNLVFDDGN